MTTRLYLRLYVHLSSSSWLILYHSLPSFLPSLPACQPASLLPSLPIYLPTCIVYIPFLTLSLHIPFLSFLACQPTHLPPLHSFSYPLLTSFPSFILVPSLSFLFIFSRTLSFLFSLPHSCIPPSFLVPSPFLYFFPLFACSHLGYLYCLPPLSASSLSLPTSLHAPYTLPPLS